MGAAFLFALPLTSCASLQEEAKYCSTDATITPIEAPADKQTLLALAKAYKSLPDEDSSHRAKKLFGLHATAWNPNLASAWFRTTKSGLLLCRYPTDSDLGQNRDCYSTYYEFKKEHGNWVITNSGTPICVY